VQVHTMFHFTLVDKALAAPDSLYLVIGFNDLKSGSVAFPCCNCSNKAPNKALVAGGYFRAKRTCNLPRKWYVLKVEKFLNPKPVRMETSKFTPTQIAKILKDFESGKDIDGLFREYGISKAFYWNEK